MGKLMPGLRARFYASLSIISQLSHVANYLRRRGFVISRFAPPGLSPRRLNRGALSVMAAGPTLKFGIMPSRQANMKYLSSQGTYGVLDTVARRK
jgi:hypothetical protein